MNWLELEVIPYDQLEQSKYKEFRSIMVFELFNIQDDLSKALECIWHLTSKKENPPPFMLFV